MVKKITLLFLLMVGALCAYSQQQVLEGTVTEAETGMPLPGVTVLEKGTTNGTSTDFEGEFAIRVTGDAILVFSMIGYESQEVPASGNLNIQLSVSSEALQEVMVTALGIKRETKQLGYAMSEVAGEELVQTNTINPVRGLQVHFYNR